jgi:hypothetical protein
MIYVAITAAPFVFGRMAEGENFTDRSQERVRLRQNFQTLTNTTIISPRRWGKSSLVKRVAKEVTEQDKGIKICMVDLFNARTEAEFYEQLVTAAVKSTSRKWEEWLVTAREFLVHLRPQLTLAGDMQNELTFDVEWEKVRKSPDEFLDLPEKLANAKGCKLVVCIDEFQNIGSFKNSLAFQKKLRSHWQNQQHVAYCLYGSKRHMLMEIFSDASMPFYRFGDIMLLSKISNADWGHFIVENFERTSKTISQEDACHLAGMVDNHSYYVQQLAQQTWLRTKKHCERAIIETALEGLRDQLSLLFSNTADALTAKQLDFLKAVIDGVEEFSAMSTLRKYNLGTSGNIRQIKAALQKQEIIDISGKEVELLDPLFKYWLKTEYFR